MRVLVVGAAMNSLGQAICAHLSLTSMEYITAGISGEETHLNLRSDSMGHLRSYLARKQPDHIICTVGINYPQAHDNRDPHTWYLDHFNNNVIGPMRLLEAWLQVREGRQALEDGHYVAISSNSARVPRCGSAAYCASKAALSQALRVKAREGALDPRKTGVVVYGYEPGLIEGTPMTDQTAEQFPDVPLTRMRPPVLARGISRHHVARMVIRNLDSGWGMSGLLLPFDADER